MNACLLIHGFTGSPYEVEPLAQFLKEQTDWKIVFPTLPGHGEILDLKGIHHKEWIEHAESELNMLLKTCDKVFVVGFSMGGLIASYLSVKYSIDKLVLLSAPAYYLNPKQLYSDIKEMVHAGWNGNIQDHELFQRYKQKIIATPISATWQFRKMVSLVRPMFIDIKVPTFIAQGTSDGIVPLKSAAFLHKHIGADQKEIFYAENAKHHICYCEKREYLFRKIYRFLKE